MINVLIVDDDSGLRLSVRSALEADPRFKVEEAFDGINGLEKVKQARFEVVLLDVDMPRLKGPEALIQIKEHNPGTIVIMMTAYATLEQAVETVKNGAFNFLQKPVTSEDLVAMIDKALMANQLISNMAASSPIMMESGRKIIANNQQMMKVFNIVNRLSKVDTPVLIRGASGTGKELVARAIHFNSSRKDGKFVAINCSAIPENLFESELFGHEKGSFTGADQRKIGKFQYAEGGTLFLDELGDLPVLMQVKLLRVLQEKLFTPVGANREIQSNVRIIAATNRPLEEMMKSGEFREDLFYRLNVIPIFLPSLESRKDDLDNLITMFIRKFNEAHTRRISGIAPDALSVLKKYEWPGNIRELENVIEHMFVMENSSKLTLSSLPESILAATGTSVAVLQSTNAVSQVQDSLAPQLEEEAEDSMLDLDEGRAEDAEIPFQAAAGTPDPNLDFNLQKEAFEKEFIIKALKTFHGRINQTALHANIPKKTLLRKIDKYGIRAKDFADGE
jgi:DNA-binding NtrC family response regulator